VADLVAVKPLEWKPAGYDGQSLEASALGLEVCFRVHGKPGDWTLTSPGAREYVHTPGYETRADATAAAQTDFERRIFAALSPAATEPVATDKSTGWLIWKNGRGWYLPDAQGYTNDVRDAGRYSHEEAIKHSHPNGPNGPRDGMTIKHESEVAAPPSPVTAEAVAEVSKHLHDIINCGNCAGSRQSARLALRALAGEKRDG